MKRLMLCAALVAAPAFSQTPLPAAPTLQANADFKGLQFDWAPAAGASWYQLEFRAHRTGPFVQDSDDLPANATSTHFSFPLHLFDWSGAHYRLAACNAAGCSRSAEVSASALRRDAVGYFKAAKPARYASFGAEVDLSPDGYSFVSAAPGENITENGVTYPGGAAYVFRRGSDGNWVQRARLTPGIPPVADVNRVMSVAIGANGNAVAVLLPYYQHAPSDPSPGELEVFTFDGGKWTRASLPHVAGEPQFSSRVALDASGTVLAASLAGFAGRAVAIYKLVDGTWENVRIIPLAVNTSERCSQQFALSRDGKTLAQSCLIPSSTTAPLTHYIRVWSGSNWSTRTDIPLVSSTPNSTGYSAAGLGISANGDTIAAQISTSGAIPINSIVAQINVFKRTNGKYTKVGELRPGAWRDGQYQAGYGETITVSGNGEAIGVGDSSDTGQGYGVREAPLSAGTVVNGAVYIYRFTTSWKLVNVVKPNRASGLVFGDHTVLSNSGKTLIIGQGGEYGGDGGIGGNWQDTSVPGAGAVFMY